MKRFWKTRSKQNWEFNLDLPGRHGLGGFWGHHGYHFNAWSPSGFWTSRELHLPKFIRP
jgi:hypothetical protein